MFAKLGLTTAIVLERNDAWGNGVYGTFSPSFPVTNRFTYTYTPDDTASFATALGLAETKASSLSDISHVGVFLIAIDTDCAPELNRGDFATAYPTLKGLPWFGADGTAFSSNFNGNNVGELKILSPNPATPHNTKFDDMATRYYPILGTMDYSGGCNIDAGWILAQAVIETRSTVFLKSPGATDVIKVLSDDCSRYFGYSGWCQLDKNGDRVSGNWDIVGYGFDASNKLVILQYGSYDAYSGVSWIATPGWP
jgi:ABC-type branched-subunit amino acid transport system substrate-binding protein